MDWIGLPLERRHLEVPSGASKMISKHVVHSGQTMRLSYVKIGNISRSTIGFHLSLSPRSTIGCIQNYFRAYGMFSTDYASILHRHQHYLQMDQNEIPHDPRDPRVPSGAFKMISEAMVRWAQTVHLSCVKFSTIFEWTESSFHLSIVT
jgi:hypothetical protein